VRPSAQAGDDPRERIRRKAGWLWRTGTHPTGAPPAGAAENDVWAGIVLSRRGRFRSRAWGPRRRRVRECKAPPHRKEASGRVPAAACRSRGRGGGGCFDHGALVNDRNHPHLMLTLRADERVAVPHLQDEVAPFFGGEFRRWRRGAGRAEGSGDHTAVLGPLALAAHCVGIAAAVADHSRGLSGRSGSGWKVPSRVKRPSATRAWRCGWKSRYSPKVWGVRTRVGWTSGKWRAARWGTPVCRAAAVGSSA
jgi:hypothetical protein